MQLSEYIEYFGFILSIILNSILFCLAVKQSKKISKSYRCVMSVFATTSIIHAGLGCFIHPSIAFFDSGFIISINDVSIYDNHFGNYMLSTFCAFFIFMISLLTTQYFYKFLLICRQVKYVRIFY
ncbi:unnamed protein product [Caenorhabditis angaria]|uniref:Uncharacterized protein n=1 Tax=Caenorhabditis angaria TaxID=860376 RepID=A0A9P1J3C0_9PELO|nr:unnamed protein product [Caenorhabditis angaria]